MGNAIGSWRIQLGAVLLAATAVAGVEQGGKADGGAERPATQQGSVPLPGRDFRLDPPRVGGLAIQRLAGDGGLFRVVVEFAPGQKLPDHFTVDVDGAKLALVPESPTAYAGTVRLDLQAFVDRQRTLDALQDQLHHELTFPIFEGRRLLERVPIVPIAIERLRAGELTKLAGSWATPAEIDADRSLVIRDPSVVGDCARTYDVCAGVGAPLGKWTFGYLMQQIAGTTDPATFTRAWLDQWSVDQLLNGPAIVKRPQMQSDIVANWPKTTTGALDLAKAPFRLVAIVNRIDLAENLLYGSGSGGEGRFVFQALGPPPLCRPLDLLVIFEYRIQKSSCTDLRDWARQWVDLAGLPFPSAAYNTALEAITEQFVKPSTALAQIRTNEIALAPLGDNTWEMREFHLEAGALKQTTVRRTPAISLNRTQRLADWVNANPGTPALPSDVPRDYPTGTAFLGGAGVMDTDAFFWNGPTNSSITAGDARHAFSLNTCNGCHAGETGTHFTHMHLVVGKATSTTLPSTCTNTAAGTTTALSGFLTGIDVADPVTGVSRHFEDLDNRRTILASIANRSCVFEFFRHPIGMIH